MTTEPISYEFIEARGGITWAEALWGYAHGHSGKGLLEEILEKNHSDMQYPVSDISANDALEKVRRLATLEPEQSPNAIARKWLYLILKHLHEQKLDVDAALGQVEIIYADFDYPREIEGFVRYMPTTDGYDPAQHSREENLQRLMTKWEDYLRSREMG